jgi:hypothetical protein
VSINFLDCADALIGLSQTNGGGLFAGNGGTPACVNDHVRDYHTVSYRFRPGQPDNLQDPSGTIADSGGRFSKYIYLAALPTATASFIYLYNSSVGARVSLRLTTAGVLQLWSGSATSQLGSNGPTLATGQWYRISGAFTITNSTTNRFEIFVDAVSAISVTNATIPGTGVNQIRCGNLGTDATLDFRMDDSYAETNSSLTDPGNVQVTAKRVFANGTLNQLTTRIGAGGSGYGTGHAPQMNERAANQTNGWSLTGSGSAVTEEFNLEGLTAGDKDLTGVTIVAVMGYVVAKAGSAQTCQIIVDGTTTNISVTTGFKTFVQMSASATYPAGTGSDIGLVTSTGSVLFSLTECGVVVAFMPAVAAPDASLLHRRGALGLSRRGGLSLAGR